MNIAVSDRQIQKKTDSRTFGCISTQKGAKEVTCPEIHEPAAVWRYMLENLPLRYRAGHSRRQGSVMTVDLEALTYV